MLTSFSHSVRPVIYPFGIYSPSILIIMARDSTPTSFAQKHILLCGVQSPNALLIYDYSCFVLNYRLLTSGLS